MKSRQKGFAYIELIISVGIMVLLAEAAAMTMFQTLKGTECNNNRMTVARQVQSAGYRISRDAQMAQTAKTDNLTAPDFLILYWIVWDSNQDPIYHSATYFFEGQTNGVGKLKRRHWSSDGANEQTLIAEHIYYNPSDPEKTSKVSYQNGELSIRLTAFTGDAREAREYRIIRRLHF